MTDDDAAQGIDSWLEGWLEPAHGKQVTSRGLVAMAAPDAIKDEDDGQS